MDQIDFGQFVFRAACATFIFLPPLNSATPLSPGGRLEFHSSALRARRRNGIELGLEFWINLVYNLRCRSGKVLLEAIFAKTKVVFAFGPKSSVARSPPICAKGDGGRPFATNKRPTQNEITRKAERWIESPECKVRGCLRGRIHLDCIWSFGPTLLARSLGRQGRPTALLARGAAKLAQTALGRRAKNGRAARPSSLVETAPKARPAPLDLARVRAAWWRPSLEFERCQFGRRGCVRARPALAAGRERSPALQLRPCAVLGALA